MKRQIKMIDTYYLITKKTFWHIVLILSKLCFENTTSLRLMSVPKQLYTYPSPDPTTVK